MKKNYMNLRLNEKSAKILYRILTVFLVICWIGIFLFFSQQIIKKRYVYPLAYKEIVFEYADKYDLDRALIFSMIKTESGFNKKAKSSKDAIGLMQIRENTGKYIAEKLGIYDFNLEDERTNINFGCYYVKYLYSRFNDINLSIIAYNAGEGNVANWLADKNLSEDGKTLKNIPFKESEKYLEKIIKNRDKYKKLYGKILDKTENIE